MTDTPPESDSTVLRPFTPSELPDLPPVEGSSVVIPEPPVEPPAPTEAAEAPTAVVTDAAWAPDDADAATAAQDGVVTAGPIADAPAVDEPEVGQLIPDDPGPDDDAGPTSPPPAGSSAAGQPDTVTVPRNVLMIGAGVAALAIVALFFLWQAAGGDADTAEPAGDTDAPATDDAAGADAGGTAADDASAAEIAALEGEVTQLGTRIGELEADLAAVRPPALPGTAMRRIVVPADASFVSLGNQGLAVIGPFGGYAAIDPATNSLTATAQVASGATRVMRTSAAVWITNYTDGEIVRVDAVSNTVLSTFDFPGPDGIAKLGDTLAVASFDGQFVAQVDPATGEILNQVEVLGKPSDVLVSADESTVWVAIFDTGEIVRIDAASFEVTDRVTVGAGPVGLSEADGVLWVANNSEGSVAGVDQASLSVISSIPVGDGPTAAVVYNGDLWVSVTDSGELVQIDRDTGEVLTRTPLGSSNRGGPSGMTVGADSLWVAMQGERSVVRISQ